jgi:hypothetical protein
MSPMVCQTHLLGAEGVEAVRRTAALLRGSAKRPLHEYADLFSKRGLLLDLLKMSPPQTRTDLVEARLFGARCASVRRNLLKG